MKYHLEVIAMGEVYAELETDSLEEAIEFYSHNYTNYDNCIIVYENGERLRLPICWKRFGKEIKF